MIQGDAVRKMRHHLLLINVVVIILDIPILILEDTGLYEHADSVQVVRLQCQAEDGVPHPEPARGHDASAA